MIETTAMELYQLRSFVAVAEEQHLTRAAARLNISQPSVSTHIKALEEELGLKLFIRTPKGMVLSDDGKMIKLKAQSALEAAEAVRFQADDLNKRLSGSVRIGLNINAQYLKSLELLESFYRGAHNIELHYRQCHSLEAHHEVKKGRLDAAFVFDLPQKADFSFTWLATFGVVAVGPYRWKSRLQNMETAKLSRFPWIWTDDRCPFNRIARRLFEPLQRLPEKAVVVDHDATIRKMVASCAGLGLMVEAEAYEAARQKEVVILGDRVADLDLSLIFLRRRSMEPLLNTVIQTICRLWSQSADKDPMAAEIKHSIKT